MRLIPIPFNRVHIQSPFWSPRLEVSRTVTLQACLDQCERTGRLANFRRAAGKEEGQHHGLCYDDSDVYKILEGAAYDLMTKREPEVEARIDAIIADIIDAQEPDGYINTWYTLEHPSEKWTNMDRHEAYCIGHMVEAAVAYDQATGKDAWLHCAERAVQHMMNRFGPGKQHWVCGHQELELALVKLYRHTHKEEYLTFARWLLEERGHGHMIAASLENGSFTSAYYQDEVPAAEMRKVTGHAVRAMYYFTAMADVDAITGEDEYKEALTALWNNVVPANLYITGGIGQSCHNEGFTRDYHKPNLTAYCETCASIGMALWNHRLNLASGESCYADIVETEMYNGALSGVSLKGDTYFYDNPLASIGTHHRSQWFGTSCCPTNMKRFLPSVGGYAYAIGDESVYVNQYIGGSLDYADANCNIKLAVTTDYPWDGRIEIKIQQCDGISSLFLRIPKWCRTFTVNMAYMLANGYAKIAIKPGMQVMLMLDMPIERIYEDERVKETYGRVCIRRGPVVYCAEEVDNPDAVPASEYFPCDIKLNKHAELVVAGRDQELMDAVVIEGGGLRFVPYAMWDNRKAGAMAVWMKEE